MESVSQDSESKPKVSVIVPVYKVDRYLTQCLDSIVNQTMKEIEIIIVDEGDQDRCREIIDYYESVDSRVIAPHRKNGGYGASCNYGMSLAKGEYISIIESDDFIEPDMYERMYEYAESLGADVVKTPYYEYRSKGKKKDCCYRSYLASMLPKNKLFSMKQFNQLLEVHASLWSGLYKTSYMREKGIKFVEAKGAAYVDVGFRIDTLINTDKVAWLDIPFYNYRLDSVDSSTNNFKIGPMIDRWHEEHLFFENIKDDYDKYYGPRLIYDEYVNTVEYCHWMKVKAEDVSSMLENMKYVSDEMITGSLSLSEKQKKDIVNFKKKPRSFLRKCRWERRFRYLKNGAMPLIWLFSRNWMLLSMFIGLISTYIGIRLICNGFLPFDSDPLFQDLMSILALSFLGVIGLSFISRFCMRIIKEKEKTKKR